MNTILVLCIFAMGGIIFWLVSKLDRVRENHTRMAKDATDKIAELQRMLRSRSGV